MADHPSRATDDPQCTSPRRTPARDSAESSASSDGLGTVRRATPGAPDSVLTSQGRGNGPARAAAILALQQTHGNRAVQRHLQGGKVAPPAPSVQRMPAAPGDGGGASPQGPTLPAGPQTDPYVQQHNLHLVPASDVERVMVGTKLRYWVDGSILVNISARQNAYPRIVRWLVPTPDNSGRQTRDPGSQGYSPDIEFARAGRYKITAEVRISPTASVLVDYNQDVSDPADVLNPANADQQKTLATEPAGYADFHQQITDHTNVLAQGAGLNTDHAAQKYGHTYIEAEGQNPLVIQQSLWHDVTGYGSSTFTAAPRAGATAGPISLARFTRRMAAVPQSDRAQQQHL